MPPRNVNPGRALPASDQPTTEVAECGCEWRIDHSDLSACCVQPCGEHPKYRGRMGLLPKPLPDDFTFAGWIATNVTPGASRRR
ncbi:MAG: hypothetical protein O2822_08325 [Chloroflexi bacterium]|nr:hypothetical protein [Chloroflexota bacterium]